MEVKVNDKWYDLDWFDDFEELEDMGEIEDTKDIPDGLDIETNWDELQEYLGLADEEQAIMMAYYEATNTFDWSEAQEAYVGEYDTGADFAQALCEEVEYEALRNMPDYLRDCIKWSDVWDCFLHYDYFEQDGLYFRSL